MTEQKELLEGAAAVYVFRSASSSDLCAQLRTLDTQTLSETLVAYRNPVTQELSCEIVLGKGSFAVKHGSFIDPADLSVYGKQYYMRDDVNGRRCAVYLAPLEKAASEDECVCRSIQELLDFFSNDEDDDSNAEDCLLIQPDSAFELHGRCTRGWHANLYIAEEGKSYLIFE